MKKGKGSQQTPDESEDSWMRDMIFQYVKSPIWIEHVENYKDEHSVYFEGSLEVPQQELLKIHEDFKNLVQFLLLEICSQMNIDDKKLLTIIQQSKRIHQHNYLDNQYQQHFSDLQLANNYDAFKEMMTLRNLEIDKEVQKGQYTTKQAYKDQFQESVWMEEERLKKNNLLKQLEDDELRRAMQLSQEEYEAYLRRLRELEDEEFQRALRLSMQYMSSQKQDEFNSVMSYNSRVRPKEEGSHQDELVQEQKYNPVNFKSIIDSSSSIEDRKQKIIEQRRMIIQKKKDAREYESKQFKENNPEYQKLVFEPKKLENLQQNFTSVKMEQQREMSNPYQSNPYQSNFSSNQYTTTSSQNVLIQLIQNVHQKQNMDNDAIKKRNSVMNRIKGQMQQKNQ